MLTNLQECDEINYQQSTDMYIFLTSLLLKGGIKLTFTLYELSSQRTNIKARE